MDGAELLIQLASATMNHPFALEQAITRVPLMEKEVEKAGRMLDALLGERRPETALAVVCATSDIVCEDTLLIDQGKDRMARFRNEYGYMLHIPAEKVDVEDAIRCAKENGLSEKFAEMIRFAHGCRAKYLIIDMDAETDQEPDPSWEDPCEANVIRSPEEVGKAIKNLDRAALEELVEKAVSGLYLDMTPTGNECISKEKSTENYPEHMRGALKKHLQIEAP